MMEMTNGVKTIYEESSLAAGYTNPWHQEYYRVECEKGSVVVDRGDRVVRVYRKSTSGVQTIEEIPLVLSLPSGHHQILNDFLSWLNDGQMPKTALENNINSAMMVFAAIASKKKNQLQFLKDYLPNNSR